MSPVYAGIGSRQTPQEILIAMRAIGSALAQRGWTLRSGNAPGADQAFQEGAWEHLLTIPEQRPPLVEVYLPWRDFAAPDRLQPSTRWILGPTHKGVEIAQQVHPRGRRLSRGAMLLHGRNTHQVLGEDTLSPVGAIICWTPDGAEEPGDIGRATGGTGQALRVAALHAPGAKIFNLQRDGRMQALQSFVMETL
jgi:hypothetical protein